MRVVGEMRLMWRVEIRCDLRMHGRQTHLPWLPSFLVSVTGVTLAALPRKKASGMMNKVDHPALLDNYLDD